MKIVLEIWMTQAREEMHKQRELKMDKEILSILDHLPSLDTTMKSRKNMFHPR